MDFTTQEPSGQSPHGERILSPEGTSSSGLPPKHETPPAPGSSLTPSDPAPRATPPADLVLPNEASRLEAFADLSDEVLDRIHIAALIDMVLNTRDPEQRLKAIHDLGEYRGKYAEATAKANAKYGPKVNTPSTNINAIIADEHVSKRLSEGLVKLLSKE